MLIRPIRPGKNKLSAATSVNATGPAKESKPFNHRYARWSGVEFHQLSGGAIQHHASGGEQPVASRLPWTCCAEESHQNVESIQSVQSVQSVQINNGSG